MKAIILAAGRGRRMGPEREPLPKCLEQVGGETLLARMLGALQRLEVREACLVVGFEAGRIRAEVAALPADARPEVRWCENPRFVRGSVLSLWEARGELEGADDALIMDADVLFPTALLARLVGSSHPSAFLLDRRSEASGEEMMLLAREGRVLRIARRIEPQPGDVFGEGVGFLKLAAAAQPQLVAALGALVEAEQLDADYEQGMDRFLAGADVRYEEVGELPWTEIDFPEDLARARDALWPAIARLES